MNHASRTFLSGLLLGGALGIAAHHLALSALANRSQDQTAPSQRYVLPYTPTNGLLTGP